MFRHVFTKRVFALSIFIHTLTLGLSGANALEATVEEFVRWETEANAVSKRSSAPFKLKHYEIPLSLLQKDLADNLDKKIRNSLIFKKNGENYVRWVINPEDTRWHLELNRFLSQHGMDNNVYEHFTAYLTASRSLIVEDPDNQAVFSIKVSTNQTGGQWRDKKQPIDDAVQVRMVSDYVRDVNDRVQFKHLIFQDEPLQMGVKEIDQALLVRSLHELPQGKHYYLPGFSALHEQVGREIAKLNGSLNPSFFWNLNYNEPLARALAEFAAHFGITYDSPHSQNFLIELDSKMKPTGRIVLRDFGDAYASAEWFEAIKRQDFLQKWESGNVVRDRLHVGVGTMHGNEYPSWLDDEIYRHWGEDFFKTFDQTFSDLTGIPQKELSSLRHTQSDRYFFKDYPYKSESWKKYFRLARCFQGFSVAMDGSPCPKKLTSKIRSSVVRGRARGQPKNCTAILRAILN